MIINIKRQSALIRNYELKKFGGRFCESSSNIKVPILVDIYSEPIISEICNVYTVDKPQISIPRIKIRSVTKSYDGTREIENIIPTATKLVRAGAIEIAVTANSTINAFTAASLDRTFFRMNRKYTLLTKVTIEETTGTDTYTHDINLNLRPDNRNQIAYSFTFKDHGVVNPSNPDSNVVECTLNGHVNYDTGAIQMHAIFAGGSVGSTFTVDQIKFNLNFTPVETIIHQWLLGVILVE